MDKENIMVNLASNPNFISGIYNYCDRWCERCPFTSRCMNFALGEGQFPDPRSRDINNAVFWEKMAEIFQVTLAMVKETAKREGIDLDALDMEAIAQQERLNAETAKNHECSRAAKVYGAMVDNWFDLAKDLFEEKEKELNMKVRLAIPGANPFDQAASLKEAVEVIRWYQHQIYVKLVRAIRGKREETSRLPDGYPNDSDGSAKVALIAIDRSIAAWGEMHNHFSEHEDDILDLLVHLERLRRKIEKVFPSARESVRPGFDDIGQRG
jgi:hypothetical protein